MKKFYQLLFILFATIVSANAQTVYNNSQDGKIYLKLKQNVDINISDARGKIKLKDAFFISSLVAPYHITNIRKPFFSTHSEILQRVYEIQFTDFAKVDMLIEALYALNITDYAERVPLDRIDYVPNDPSYSSQQWYLPLIHAPQAWDISKGSKSIVVAVVDAAVSTTHPDLAPNIWVNPGEIPGNSIDDDGNGFVDDVNGFDVGNDDNNPNPPTTSWSHGTHCAGIVGAAADNGTGIASIGFGISIMAVKATNNSSSSTSITNGYEGITYAADAGADVINNSWGGGSSSQTGQNAINYAAGKGCVVVAAAGNNSSSSNFYPAAYNNVISVASTTNTDVKSSFSNYGTTVDISAPGSNIYSTIPSTGYTTMSGTSMASPMVAGLCGLMLSVSPLTPAQVETCLKSSADNIDAKNPTYVGKLGAGRINAEGALMCASTLLSAPPVADFASDVTTTCIGVIKFTDQSTYNPATWNWSFGDNSFSTLQNPTHTYLSNGTYAVKLTVTNSNGADSITKTSFITVNKPLAPSVTPASRCGNGTLDLSATASGSGILNWYDNISGGTLVGTGNTFTTPVLSSTQTYYVEEVVAAPVQKVGPANNTFGTGGNYTDDRRLYFDVFAPCSLLTVKVYATGAGNRTIQVLNAGSTVINTVTVNVPDGESRVTLNFSLTPGIGYQIKCSGTTSLYRNSSNSVFPYSIAGLLSITGTDAGVAGYYYFFYDWEVTKVPCISPRTPVTASITLITPSITQNGNVHTSTPGTSYQWYLNGVLIPGATSQTYIASQTGSYSVEVTSNGCTVMSPAVFYTEVGISAVEINELKIFPNPVKETLEINGVNTLQETLTMEMVNVMGEKVWMKEAGRDAHVKEIINMRGFSSGVYFLQLKTDSQSFVKKIVKE